MAKSPMKAFTYSASRQPTSQETISYQLRQDVDHYNGLNPTESPIQLILDFRDDIEEKMVANGLDLPA
jgi:hypothetical protein